MAKARNRSMYLGVRYVGALTGDETVTNDRIASTLAQILEPVQAGVERCTTVA